MSAEPRLSRSERFGPVGQDDSDAYRAAFRTGTAAGSYAAVEHAIAVELLAGHDGEAATKALAGLRDGMSAALLVASGPNGRYVAVGDAAWLLAVSAPIVLYDAAEVPRRPLPSLADEDLFTLDVSSVSGHALCDRPECVTCGLAPARLRCRAAGYLCGVARGAIDATVRYVTSRAQFGRPIGHNQAVAFELAALSARLTAVDALGVRVAAGLGTDPERLRHASWLLACCAELAVDATGSALHLHGAAGMLAGHQAQRYYRQACAFSVRHGTPSQLRRCSAR